MAKRKLKKGNEVVVITGSEKGKSGKILQFVKNDRVVVEGIKMLTVHEKKSNDNPDGRIVKREGSIHISNVMDKEAFEAKKSKSV